MHIQLVHLRPFDSLFERESTTRREEREKQEHICRINEQVDQNAPHLCVIHGIGRKGCPWIPTAPKYGGQQKKAPSQRWKMLRK